MLLGGTEKGTSLIGLGLCLWIHIRDALRKKAADPLPPALVWAGFGRRGAGILPETLVYSRLSGHVSYLIGGDIAP